MSSGIEITISVAEIPETAQSPEVGEIPLSPNQELAEVVRWLSVGDVSPMPVTWAVEPEPAAPVGIVDSPKDELIPPAEPENKNDDKPDIHDRMVKPIVASGLLAVTVGQPWLLRHELGLEPRVIVAILGAEISAASAYKLSKYSRLKDGVGNNVDKAKRFLRMSFAIGAAVFGLAVAEPVISQAKELEILTDKKTGDAEPSAVSEVDADCLSIPDGDGVLSWFGAKIEYKGPLYRDTSPEGCLTRIKPPEYGEVPTWIFDEQYACKAPLVMQASGNGLYSMVRQKNPELSDGQVRDLAGLVAKLNDVEQVGVVPSGSMIMLRGCLNIEELRANEGLLVATR